MGRAVIAMIVWALFAAGAQRASAEQEIHPRLFLTPERLEEIRAAIDIEDSHHSRAYAEMKARVDSGNYEIYGEGLHYSMSFLAREAAMMYAISGDTSYATLAFTQVSSIMATDENRVRRPDSGYALGRGTVGINIALTYDWCYNGWPVALQQWMRTLIVRSLNEWTELEYPEKRGNHVWAPFISNWVPVALGPQLLMMLAVYEEDDTDYNIYHGFPLMTRRERYQTLKDTLAAHIRNAYGNLGVTGESIGYASLAGAFLPPAVYALGQTGDTSLDSLFDSKAWWRWAMYANSFADSALVLQNSITGETIGAQGWYSLLLNAVPEQYLPYFVYFYDRTIGVRGNVADRYRYDGRRAGTTWSLLYYPENVMPLDPSGVLAPMAVDSVKGAFYFRNRWRDQDDVLFLCMADAGWQENVWNQCEAFSLNLIANNHRFIAGPGREYDPGYYSALLVDGKAYIPSDPGEEPSDTGAIAFWAGDDRGGYVIIDGAQKYQRLGCDSAYRHVAVDFGGQEFDAVIGVLDRIRSQTPHAYTWQLNVGASEDDGGIAVSRGEESGRQTFTLTAGNGAYVKGWVIAPTEVNFVAGDPLMVTTGGTDADIFVVMVAGRGEAPEATITGEGLESALSVGQAQVRFDSELGRMVGVSESATEATFNPLHAASRSGAMRGVRYDPGARVISVAAPHAIGSRFAAIACRDMRGRIVAAQTLSPGATEARLRLERPLPAGIYVVSIQDGPQTISQTFIAGPR